MEMQFFVRPGTDMGGSTNGSKIRRLRNWHLSLGHGTIEVSSAHGQ
jgi:hypothetical protein